MGFGLCFLPCGMMNNRTRKAPVLLGAWAPVACIMLAGCATILGRLPPLPPNSMRPVVAVTDFENQSGFSGQWQLGTGVPDLLVAELLRTERVIVVDRKNLNSVLEEISRQGLDLFRKENRVERGRLLNARYLIRGVITDFTQTRSATGWFRSSGTEAGARAARAVVMIHLTLTDVETGEVLLSIPAEGTARASAGWIDFDYNKTSFGGELFFRTPIGKATQEAIRKAVLQIVTGIPYATWEPRVADVIGDKVIVNGGENVGIRENDLFEIKSAKVPVTDPITGDVIAWLPGKTLGRISITRVDSSSSEGVVIAGEAKRGDHMERMAKGL